jgi:hypothetical protein
MMIKHLSHSEINRQKWDNCIENSYNRIPYARTWWLDIVSPGWEALVNDDYKAIMPLTQKRKFGIRYLIQPYLTQQLGVFSPGHISSAEINEFLLRIPSYYRFVHIHLNSHNAFVNALFKINSRNSYILDLALPYEDIFKGYRRNCRRNILKAGSAGLITGEGPTPFKFTEFIRNYLSSELIGIKENFYRNLEVLAKETIKNGTGQIKGVYVNKQLVAAGWFVSDCSRLLFLVCASTPEGKKSEAMYMLVDHVIRIHAGKGLVFDFAGSDIPGVAYFNSGFGAIKQSYYAIRSNMLYRQFNKK